VEKVTTGVGQYWYVEVGHWLLHKSQSALYWQLEQLHHSAHVYSLLHAFVPEGETMQLV
jgi:hypothetical protein